MLLAPFALLLGILAGLIAGGRPGQNAPLRLSWWWLLPAAAALWIVVWTIDDLAGELVLVTLTLAALVALALGNWRLTGASIVAVGLALNLAALAIDGAVVVGDDAAASAGVDSGDDLGPARRAEVPDDRVVLLGDVIPVPRLGWLVSFGDLIALAGLVDVGFRLMRPVRRLETPSTDTGAPTAGDEPDDDWLAIVRGERDGPSGLTPAPAMVTPPTGPIRLGGQTAVLTSEQPVVRPPTVPAAREPEIDLSLVRWGSAPPARDVISESVPSGSITPGAAVQPTDDDDQTGELDLASVPGLADEPDASPATASETPTPVAEPAEPVEVGPAEAPAPAPAAHVSTEVTSGAGPETSASAGTAGPPGDPPDGEFARLLARFDAERRVGDGGHPGG